MAQQERATNVVDYLRRDDVDVVLRRLPSQVKLRLRDVFFSGKSYGVRWLGSVRNRGRRDINMYSRLPPRVSLGRFLVNGPPAASFGAPARGQWPPWAVRRFLLYEVFLHELGHLQLVDGRKSSWRRRYAAEKLAQRFANEWRQRVWDEPIEHPDPVHHPPEPDELAFLPVWEKLRKRQRLELVQLILDAPHHENVSVDRFGDLSDIQAGFLRRATYWNSST